MSSNLVRVQELYESRGGRPGLSVLTSLTVSVDVKQHCTVLRQWSQFVPNMSTDIRGHESLLHHQQPGPGACYLLHVNGGYVDSFPNFCVSSGLSKTRVCFDLNSQVRL